MVQHEITRLGDNMHTHLSGAISFGRRGNCGDFQISGWSVPEEESSWSDGHFSSLSIEAPDAPFGFFIEAEWQPALKPPYISRQIVIVEINSQVVNSFAIDRPGYFSFLCPSPLKGEKRLVIGFRFPNAFRPCDINISHDKRRLAICFRRIRILVMQEPWRVAYGDPSCAQISYSDVPGMKDQAEKIAGVPLDKLLHGFETLAGNCDLGLALREMGFEKLSLLRFGGASVSTAMRGLENDFAGIGQSISLSIADNPAQEWMVTDKFGLYFHSGQSSLLIKRATVEGNFPRYVEFLRRKFLEDLDEGTKVFVYADHKDYVAARSLEDILPLYLALRRRSRANMLWVYPSNDERAKGSVREILPGLAVGLIDPTSPPVLIGGGITVSGWLTVLCNAWRVFHQSEEEMPK
jgi:hypothetical protein